MFKGYFIKQGNLFLPLSGMIARGGYSATPNMLTDKNSYTDGNGLTHRKILPHTKSKIFIQTLPLTEKNKLIFQSVFPNKKLVKLEYWNDEVHDYCNGSFYIPEIKYEIDIVDRNKILKYNPIQLTLIEY